MERGIWSHATAKCETLYGFTVDGERGWGKHTFSSRMRFLTGPGIFETMIAQI